MRAATAAAHLPLPALIKQLLRSWVLPFADPRAIASIVRVPAFVREWRSYRAMSSERGVTAGNLMPCLLDRTARTPFDPHYFYQGAWLARELARARPAFHTDVGSSVLMVSVMSAHVPTVFVDYRPIAPGLDGILPVAASLTGLPFADRSIASVSCLHVVEHVGLGRYGDPLDPMGSTRALAELARVVAPGGRLYLSVPVGRERVCFNAHRVFDPATIVAGVAPLGLARFSLVDDAGRFRPEAAPGEATECEYGCGMFVFERPPEGRA